MGKSDAEVIAIFNEQVNMTADELEAWLEDLRSREAGTGVGIESGRHIVEILRKNPERKPDRYDEEDLAHIRKVVSYNSRHLAQEDHLKETKTIEELEQAKSTIRQAHSTPALTAFTGHALTLVSSLKNWGHDPVKVKLKREADKSQKDSTNSDGGNGASMTHSSSASPGDEQEHDSDKDADGEPDTQANSSNRDTGSESDQFEDAETGRKRALRGPPTGTEHRGYGSRHAGGDMDDSQTGVGRNKRLHRDERDLDDDVQDV